jgi:hypothetical protein
MVLGRDLRLVRGLLPSKIVPLGPPLDCILLIVTGICSLLHALINEFLRTTVGHEVFNGLIILIFIKDRILALLIEIIGEKLVEDHVDIFGITGLIQEIGIGDIFEFLLAHGTGVLGGQPAIDTLGVEHVQTVQDSAHLLVAQVVKAYHTAALEQIVRVIEEVGLLDGSVGATREPVLNDDGGAIDFIILDIFVEIGLHT